MSGWGWGSSDRPQLSPAPWAFSQKLRLIMAVSLDKVSTQLDQMTPHLCPFGIKKIKRFEKSHFPLFPIIAAPGPPHKSCSSSRRCRSTHFHPVWSKLRPSRAHFKFLISHFCGLGDRARTFSRFAVRGRATRTLLRSSRPRCHEARRMPT